MAVVESLENPRLPNAGRGESVYRGIDLGGQDGHVINGRDGSDDHARRPCFSGRCHHPVDNLAGEDCRNVFDAGLVQLVELDHVISPEIRLTPSIGHTPGHVSVMIESEAERAVITGDMTHHPCQLAHPDWMFMDHDSKAAVLTRWRLFAEWADQTILVIGTHFPAPTAGYVVRDAAAFRFAV